MFAQPPKRQKLKDFNSIEDLVRHIKEARRILVLTGAGVSVRYNIEAHLLKKKFILRTRMAIFMRNEAV